MQLNGYQTVCDGCFAPFAYKQPLDQRFGNVNEFRTDAGSNYTGLQTSATKQFGGLTLRGNYTYSHCLDEVSNGGLLPFSSLGILYPLPGDLRKEYGNCDYDVRHNLSAFAIYEIPFHSSHALLRQAFSGWQVSQTAFLHSGLPFSVVSAPYTANNNGVFQGSGPQYANRVPGVPLYRKSPVSGVTQPGSLQWLNPDAFVSVVDPSTGACAGGDSTINCQFGDSGRNNYRGPHFTYSELYLTKKIKLTEHASLPLRYAILQPLQPPQLCSAHQSSGYPRQASHANRLWRLDQHDLPSDRIAGRRLGRRQLATHDRIPGKDRILKPAVITSRLCPSLGNSCRGERCPPLCHPACPGLPW